MKQHRGARNRNEMTVADVRRFAHRGRMEALDTRDPIAIRQAHGRWVVVGQALADLHEDEIVNLNTATVGVKLAGEALGYTPQQIRKLIRERKLAAQKQGDQWRIPLKALL